MLLRFVVLICGAIFMVCFASQSIFAQDSILEIGELIFDEYPQNPSDTIEVTGVAVSGKTRWDYIVGQGIALPTSLYGNIYASCAGNDRCGFDAADSKESEWPDMAWAWYAFTFNCKIFSIGFKIDFRDRDWKSNYHDLPIRYFVQEDELKYQDQYGTWHVISEGDTLQIWNIFGDPTPNRTALLVPTTATNSFSGGQIGMDGTNYNTPNTLNWGWTLTKTIEAISPQGVGGIVYGFSQWSDGVTAQSRNVYIDDLHYSYSFTAQFGYPSQSLSQTATAYNNGRRLVRDSNNRYHLLYESGGEIIYRRTNVGGTSWEDPLRISDGLGNNKYPSIVWENGKIYTLWQKYVSGSSYTIYFRANLGSGWGTTVSLGSITCSSPNNPQPVLTRKEVRISGGIRKIRLLGCWKTNSGISHRYSENDGTSWSSAALLPSTGATHKNPSLSPGASFDWTFLDIYATYDNGSTILLNKYHTNLSNNTTAWGTAETVPGSSGTTASCSQVTSDANEPQPHAYIVWQGVDPILEAEGVYYQRKSGTDGSWSAVQSYVKEFQQPSITNLASGNLAMLWDEYSSIYKATYNYGTGIWSARQLVAPGFSPNTSISFGNDNPPSAAKYIWTSGSSSPYNLNLSSETLQKHELLADKYHRRVTVANSTQALLTVDLGDIYFRTKDGAAIPLKFTAVDDTLLIRTGHEFWSYLDSKPCLVPSEAESLVVELGTYGLNSGKLAASESSPLTVTLQMMDADDRSELLQVGREEVISESGRRIVNKAAEVSCFAKRKVYTRVVVSGLDDKREDLVYSLTHVYDGRSQSQFEKEGPRGQALTSVPKIFDLSQNYPNPFNPETNIGFALPEASKVRVEIYNVLGPKIATSVNADMPAGNHFVRWNGRNPIGEKVGAGIYLCRMQSGEFVKTQKMTLLP